MEANIVTELEILQRRLHLKLDNGVLPKEEEMNKAYDLLFAMNDENKLLDQVAKSVTEDSPEVRRSRFHIV